MKKNSHLTQISDVLLIGAGGWDHCGVIKNEQLLIDGLKKINDIKSQLKNIGLKINDNHCKELYLILDLQSSFISAEATIISALARKESRGAHQRNDFQEINKSFECNFLVEMNSENNKLKSLRSPLKKLNKKLKDLTLKFIREDTNKTKLLE